MKNFQNYRQKNQMCPRQCRVKVNAYVHKAPAKSQRPNASRVVRNGLNSARTPRATPAPTPASSSTPVSTSTPVTPSPIDSDYDLNLIFDMILETISELPLYPSEAPHYSIPTETLDDDLESDFNLVFEMILETISELPRYPSKVTRYSVPLMEDPDEFADGYHLEALFAPTQNQAVAICAMEEPQEFEDGYHLMDLFALPSSIPASAPVFIEPEELEVGYFLAQLYELASPLTIIEKPEESEDDCHFIELSELSSLPAVHIIDEPEECPDAHNFMELFEIPCSFTAPIFEVEEFEEGFFLKELSVLPTPAPVYEEPEEYFGGLNLENFFSIPPTAAPEIEEPQEFADGYHLEQLFEIPSTAQASFNEFADGYHLKALFCLPKPQYDFGDSYNLDTLFHSEETLPELSSSDTDSSNYSEASIPSTVSTAPTSTSSIIHRIKTKLSSKLQKNSAELDHHSTKSNSPTTPKTSWRSYLRYTRSRLIEKTKHLGFMMRSKRQI